MTTEPNNFSEQILGALKIVKSDLIFIKEKWNNEIDDDSLRRYSPVLRNLLVDEGGLLLKTQEWLDHRIYIQAPPNPIISINKNKINYYTAGGANYKRTITHSIYEVNYLLSDREIKQMYESGKNQPKVKYSIEEFLNAPCIIYHGETFSRIELIKFVSNKLGGTHYELEKKKMARMKLLLDVKNTYEVVDKNAIYFEFLSIGQLLVKSRYIDRLIRKIDKYI